METKKLEDVLSENRYPGRGIILGRNDTGKKTVLVYFIMGRSENSRNRVFVEDGEGLRTKAFDDSKMTDPSLVIYHPVRVLGKTTIVTNGDQTDTVYDYLNKKKTFEDALRTRCFEPDGPNFTPRISGMVDLEQNGYRLSILKSACGDESSVRRMFFEYDAPRPGEGHFIHTYMEDGDPLPSFEGEPEQVELKGDIDELTDTVWLNLDDSNKVSLFVRFLDLESGEAETRIVNKHK